jgi:DNA-binding MarR family transcriptional regulator
LRQNFSEINNAYYLQGDYMQRVKPGVYGMVPIALIQDDRVKVNMIKVYAALASFQGNSDTCWPSRKKIVERSGISATAVSTALTALVEAGWIIREHRYAQNKSNVYSVLVDAEPVETETSESDPVPETDTPPVPETGTSPVPETGTPLYMKRTIENTIMGSKNDPDLTAPSALGDPVAAAIETAFTKEVPLKAWGNVGKERKQIGNLKRKAATLSELTGMPLSKLLDRIFTTYAEMRRYNTSHYWGNAPWTPSGLITRWDAVVEQMRQDHARDQAIERGMQDDDRDVPF